MPFKIQRVPLGLQNLLSTSGGETPAELEERVRGVIDLLQLYGLNQRQNVVSGPAAVAEGTSVDVVLNATNWVVLFQAQAQFAKTATMTALYGEVFAQRAVAGVATLIEGKELSPFGATVAGSITIGGYLPYPLLCPPGSRVRGIASIIGTDATCTINVAAEIGVIG